MKNFSKDELKHLIKSKYGSLSAYANEVGISKQALDTKMNRPSYQFLRQLIEKGVITQTMLSEVDRVSQIIESNMGNGEMIQLQNVSGKGHKITVIDKNVSDEVCKSCDTRRMLETQIEQLREIIKAKDELISLLKK